MVVTRKGAGVCADGEVSEAIGGGDRPLDRRNVMVIGTGPLARTMIFGASRRHGLVSVSGGDDRAAQQLASDTGARYVPVQNLYDTLVDVVVLADPALELGPGRGQLNPSFLRPPMLVTDVAAGREDSEALTESRSRGCPVVEPETVWWGMAESLFRSITGQELPPDIRQP